MATDDNPQPFEPPQAIPGDPLLPPTEDDRLVVPPVASGATAEPPTSTPTVIDEPVGAPPVEDRESSPGEGAGDEDDGRGKLKTGALLAGAAALANKVRQEAPKKVQQLREKRAEGRCVIVTEVDGRMLAIGPYKDGAAAEAHAFRVGGIPHVVELVSDVAFFAPVQEGSNP